MLPDFTLELGHGAGALSLRTDAQETQVAVPMDLTDIPSGGELGGHQVSLEAGVALDQPLDGYIAELIVVCAFRSADHKVFEDAAEESARVQLLGRYFQQKYGIPF